MEKPFNGPIFIENPNGSLVQGVVPGYLEQTPPGTPRLHEREISLTLNVDIVRVLARHETLFLSLLLLQLLVEIAFQSMHLKYSEDAVFELSLIYPSFSRTLTSIMFWIAFVGKCLFSLSYFCLGVMAAFTSRVVLYHRFATVALIGTLGELPLAYLNQFNLLSFFLQFISYAYARFHVNLLQGVNILREELALVV